MNEDKKWGKLFYDTGEIKFEGFVDNDIPCGVGVTYFKNGNKHMEGVFADWFIEIGREYYENGALRYEGEYNKGPRNYYGPRYFIKGKLYRDDGSLWFDGEFIIFHSFSVGYPMFKGEDSFLKGIIYEKDGISKPIDRHIELKYIE